MKDFKNIRTRNWAFIMYPDSMPDNDFNTSIRILSDYFLPFAVSPLHDKDVNPDGEPKKPHYHVLITSDGVKSYNQVLEIAKSVNGSDCRPIDSASGYFRYFTHKDNPEKAQYLDVDIKCYNNFNIDLYTKPTSMQRYLLIKDMIKFVKDNDITEYCRFVDICANVNFEWFKLLCDNSSYIVIEYIKSVRNSKKQDLEEKEKDIERREYLLKHKTKYKNSLL